MKAVIAATIGLALTSASARATDIPMDCNHDGQVAINELIAGVNIALSDAPEAPATCTNADSNLDGVVLIADLVRGVEAALSPPVPRPVITKIEIADEQLVEISGTGVVGDHVSVDMRQAGFINRGTDPFYDPAHTASDSFCGFLNGGNWIGLGDEVTVGADGGFTIVGLNQRVVPGYILTNQNPANCPADPGQYYGLLSELRVNSAGYGLASPEVPSMRRWLEKNQSGTAVHLLEVGMSGGNRVSAGITDGPDQDAAALGGKDEDERGLDTCYTRGLGCGQRVDFGGPNATYPAVSQTENDASVCGISGCNPQDKEFQFILSMAQTHQRGGSLLAFMKSKRNQDPLNGFQVYIHLSGKVKVGLGLNFCFLGIGC